MAEKKQDDSLLMECVQKAGIASEGSFLGRSHRSGFLENNQFVMKKTELEKVKDLQVHFSKALELPQAIFTQQRLSDGELADQSYEGKNVNYEVFFLTAYTNRAGANGPYYIQLEGELDHTNLHTFWPYNSNGEWNTRWLHDKYVGKMTKIRLAAGTSNDWCPMYIIIFYPRGHVRAYNSTWVQTDGHTVIEISVSLNHFLEKQKSMSGDKQTNKESRKLAAIMFSDMVDYSALAQKNESLAIGLLEEHRRILRAIFPKHEGHEVEAAGDSFFVEFLSALEAVNCAIEIQKALFSHNRTATEEKKINIRIGVHLADVVHKGANVIGDGVNIAARIEPLAQTGGICISQDVVRQIQNKIDYPLRRFETANLKNIKQSIDIYTIDLPWLDKKFKPKSTKKHNKRVIWSVTILSVALLIIGGYYVKDLLTPVNIPQSKSMPVVQLANSIAILPFKDLSPDGDQEWFCDGMTEQIISNLAKLPRLKVISRTSVMRYKESEKTIPEIGKELNVAHILEGSIQKFGDRIRVTVQLIGTKNDFHIWTETYDEEYKELLKMQNDISESIAANLLAKFLAQDITEIKASRPRNTEAYEYLQKGNYDHDKLFVKFDLND